MGAGLGGNSKIEVIRSEKGKMRGASNLGRRKGVNTGESKVTTPMRLEKKGLLVLLGRSSHSTILPPTPHISVYMCVCLLSPLSFVPSLFQFSFLALLSHLSFLSSFFPVTNRTTEFEWREPLSTLGFSLFLPAMPRVVTPLNLWPLINCIQHVDGRSPCPTRLSWFLHMQFFWSKSPQHTEQKWVEDQGVGPPF